MAKEAGIADGTTVMDDDYVVWSNNAMAGYNTVDHGDLDAMQSVELNIDGTTTTVQVQSSFSLLKIS